MATLNVQICCEPVFVSACARELRARLAPDQWETLSALAAEVLSLREAETGSLVVVVPANRQSAAVAAALGAPGLDRQVAKLNRR